MGNRPGPRRTQRRPPAHPPRRPRRRTGPNRRPSLPPHRPGRPPPTPPRNQRHRRRHSHQPRPRPPQPRRHPSRPPSRRRLLQLLEYDLDSGQRGGRYAQLESLLQQLTGAEAALAVNNNAAAILLALSALAAGRQVIVSRAEAVEIGGGFRIPDVLQQSGAALIDIGATNRTYLRDYQDATTNHTAAYLKVHASNFRIQGFTAEVDPQQLAALADRLGVAALHDVGSGSLLPTENYGLAHEPMPQESIRAGMGLVFFSGDKLLGGPQAGIIAGRRPLVAQLARHPLARAVRLDKLSLAALNATLTHYLRNEAEQEIPIWQMISATPESLHQRARQWQQQLCPEPHDAPPPATP